MESRRDAEDRRNREEMLSEAKKEYALGRERIFTLATGALALSVTFKKSLVGGNSDLIWMLSVSWIAFAVSIGSYIAGSLFAARVYIAAIQRTSLSLSWKEKGLIAIPHFFVTCGFVVGIVSLVVFAVANNH